MSLVNLHLPASWVYNFTILSIRGSCDVHFDEQCKCTRYRASCKEAPLVFNPLLCTLIKISIARKLNPETRVLSNYKIIDYLEILEFTYKMKHNI